MAEHCIDPWSITTRAVHTILLVKDVAEVHRQPLPFGDQPAEPRIECDVELRTPIISSGTLLQGRREVWI